MCQRTTSAITYIYASLGYHCRNYIDDFGGAETLEHSSAAFQALGPLLARLELETFPDKDSPPSNSMIFLGILVDTEAMTLSITPDRVQELLLVAVGWSGIPSCPAILTWHHVLRHCLCMARTRVHVYSLEHPT